MVKHFILPLLLFFFSISLFAESTVEILPPVIEGESEEIVTLVTDALQTGVDEAVSISGSKVLQLQTWFRREGLFYKIKIELDGTGLQERYSVEDISALGNNIILLVKTVALNNNFPLIRV